MEPFSYALFLVFYSKNVTVQPIHSVVPLGVYH